MKQLFLSIGIFFILVGATYAEKHQKSHNIQTIVFLRHGEKPFLDFGQLNCQGLNRALALPKVLQAKYGKPDYIIAPNPHAGGYYYYVRGLVMIEPAAIQWGLPVRTDWPYFHYNDAALMILEPQYHSAVVFVTWEHLNIPLVARKLLEKLNVNPEIIPPWSGSDFDSLYVLTIDWNKKPVTVTFVHDYQNLNNQDTNCPVINNFIKTDPPKDLQKFVIIPSVEGLNHKWDQLSCKGLNRSLQLPKVLERLYPNIDLFVLPAGIDYPLLPTKFIRALMTIEPTIISRGSLFIPISYKKLSDIGEMIKSNVGNRTVVIIWPKEEMPSLARVIYALNGGNINEIPTMIPSHDTMYEIVVDTFRARFKTISEQLDNASDQCPRQ